MAVTANTNETYDVTSIKEDFLSAMASISPTETFYGYCWHSQCL